MPCSKGTARSKMRFLAEAASTTPIVNLLMFGCVKAFVHLTAFIRPSCPSTASATADQLMLTLPPEVTCWRVDTFRGLTRSWNWKTHIAKSESAFGMTPDGATPRLPQTLSVTSGCGEKKKGGVLHCLVNLLSVSLNWREGIFFLS